MCTPDSPRKDLEIGTPEWHEPFPKPQTIPSGWDLSELLPVSMPVSFGDKTAKSED